MSGVLAADKQRPGSGEHMKCLISPEHKTTAHDLNTRLSGS